eukprot:5551878-Pyramimonas_sp.AAC.1
MIGKSFYARCRVLEAGAHRHRVAPVIDQAAHEQEPAPGPPPEPQVAPAPPEPQAAPAPPEPQAVPAPPPQAGQPREILGSQ